MVPSSLGSVTSSASSLGCGTWIDVRPIELYHSTHERNNEEAKRALLETFAQKKISSSSAEALRQELDATSLQSGIKSPFPVPWLVVEFTGIRLPVVQIRGLERDDLVPL